MTKTLRRIGVPTFKFVPAPLAAATGQALSPTVDSRVRRTISDDDDAERRRPRTSRSEVGLNMQENE